MPMNEDQEIKYTTAISKGAGMIEETRSLLIHWRPSEPIDVFARRVQENGILSNSTAYRTRDLVKRVFAPRFLKPTDKPARLMQGILSAGLSGRVFTELLFLFIARQDPLVYDFTIKEYWPSVRRGRSVMEPKQLLSFLSEAQYDGRLTVQWSEKVSARVARSILGVLRDVGFLREMGRARKEILDYQMSDEGLVLMARELHESGITDSSLCNHPDWALFGMKPSGVLERLSELGEHRGLIVQRAGSVVHLTWGVKTIEELIDVLAR